MSAVYGVGVESDATDIALFFVLHCGQCASLSMENLKAINLGSGQSPVSRRLLSVQALALAHGLLTVNENRVCVMDNAVANRISKDRIRELVPPPRNVELGTQNGGSPPVASIHDLKQIAGFAFFQRIQQPLVNDQQGILLVLRHKLANRSIAPGDAEFHQKIRQTNVFHRQELPGSCHAQSTSQIGLTAAGGSQQDDIVVFMDIVAGAQTEQLIPLQFPIRQILDILQASVSLGEGGVPNQAIQMVALSSIPFCVNKEPQAIFKCHAVVLMVFQLVFQRICHHAQSHFTEFGKGRFDQHSVFLLS